MMETDALVIGGGLAGLTAAWSLKLPHGMKTMVLATGAGASPYVHGFNIPLDPCDSPEQFLQDTMKSGYYQGDPMLAEALCGDSPKIPGFLEELGIDLDRKGGEYALLRPLGASVPRVASAGNHTGAVIMKKLRGRLEAESGVQFYEGLRALRLYTENGAVQGVLAYDTVQKKFTCIRAKAVILAAGGFCNIFPFSTNSSDIGGDGIAMAYLAGAPLVDMEFIQFEPSVALYPKQVRGKGMITTLFYEGAVLLNGKKERFMLDYGPKGERVDKDVLAYAIYQEVQKNPSPHGGVWFDATGVPAQTLQEAYPMYVKRYADVGIDITKEPFEVGCAPHTSLGGVEIAPTGATLVRGLFACGEAVGGLHGANRIGGNAGLETLVFGRRAGETAAAYLSGFADDYRLQDSVLEEWTEQTAFPNRPSTEMVTVQEIRSRMEKALEQDLNVARSRAGLRRGLEELDFLSDALPQQAMDPESAYEQLRLENDLYTARLAFTAALERKSSAGCHIREDAEPETQRYRVELRRTPQGVSAEKKYLERDDGI